MFHHHVHPWSPTWHPGVSAAPLPSQEVVLKATGNRGDCKGSGITSTSSEGLTMLSLIPDVLT